MTTQNESRRLGTAPLPRSVQQMGEMESLGRRDEWAVVRLVAGVGYRRVSNPRGVCAPRENGICAFLSGLEASKVVPGGHQKTGEPRLMFCAGL